MDGKAPQLHPSVPSNFSSTQHHLYDLIQQPTPQPRLSLSTVAALWSLCHFLRFLQHPSALAPPRPSSLRMCNRHSTLYPLSLTAILRVHLIPVNHLPTQPSNIQLYFHTYIMLWCLCVGFLKELTINIAIHSLFFRSFRRPQIHLYRKKIFQKGMTILYCF